MNEIILSVYDGSPAGDEGIRLACALALLYRRRVGVLSISIVPRSLPLTNLPEWMDQRAQDQLVRASTVAASCECEVETRMTRAYELLRAVKEECLGSDIFAVVMGVGRSRWHCAFNRQPVLTSRMLGSVSCPVFIAYSPTSHVPAPAAAVAEAERLLHEAV